MTIEIISWSISRKVWDRAWIKLATPGSAVRLTSVARHVTDCAMRPGLAKDMTLSWIKMKIFLWFLHENMCCGAHWKRLSETLPKGGHNIMFLLRNKEISFMNTTHIKGFFYHVCIVQKLINILNHHLNVAKQVGNMLHIKLKDIKSRKYKQNQCPLAAFTDCLSICLLCYLLLNHQTESNKICLVTCLCGQKQSVCPFVCISFQTSAPKQIKLLSDLSIKDNIYFCPPPPPNPGAKSSVHLSVMLSTPKPPFV